MPQENREHPKSKTDTPHRQHPGVHGSIDQAQEFISDDPGPGLGSVSTDPNVEKHRAEVPVGPDEKDKRVPPSVAQGD